MLGLPHPKVWEQLGVTQEDGALLGRVPCSLSVKRQVGTRRGGRGWRGGRGVLGGAGVFGLPLEESMGP